VVLAQQVVVAVHLQQVVLELTQPVLAVLELTLHLFLLLWQQLWASDK
jgi:hypothetical protein